MTKTTLSVLALILCSPVWASSAQQAVAKAQSYLSEVKNSSTARIIYGSDDRGDLRDVTDAGLQEAALATAAMVPQWKLDLYLKPDLEPEVIAMMTLGESKNLCASERFVGQPSLSSCSGFLVGEKTLVTAGHCLDAMGTCGEKVWVFDYALDTPGIDRPLIEQSNIYSCSRVVKTVLNERSKLDYAVIELDRPVVGRQPLRYRTKGKVQIGTSLVVIGYPSGVPVKIAGGAKVMKRKTNYFGANLDTYGGNSGSAVLNAKTMEVEGILVRGDEDYIGTADGCRVSNVIAKPKATEEVTRITRVPGLPKSI